MEKKNILQFSQVFQVPIDDVWKKTRFKERHFLVILDSASAPTVHPTDRGDPESLFNEAGVRKKFVFWFTYESTSAVQTNRLTVVPTELKDDRIEKYVSLFIFISKKHCRATLKNREIFTFVLCEIFLEFRKTRN